MTHTVWGAGGGGGGCREHQTDHSDSEGCVGYELVFGVSDPVARGGGPPEMNDALSGGSVEECSVEHVRLMPGLCLPSSAPECEEVFDGLLLGLLVLDGAAKRSLFGSGLVLMLVLGF